MKPTCCTATSCPSATSSAARCGPRRAARLSWRQCGNIPCRAKRPARTWARRRLPTKQQLERQTLARLTEQQTSKEDKKEKEKLGSENSKPTRRIRMSTILLVILVLLLLGALP